MYESHVAESVLEEMLPEANISIVINVQGLEPETAVFSSENSTILVSVVTVSGLKRILETAVQKRY